MSFVFWIIQIWCFGHPITQTHRYSKIFIQNPQKFLKIVKNCLNRRKKLIGKPSSLLYTSCATALKNSTKLNVEITKKSDHQLSNSNSFSFHAFSYEPVFPLSSLISIYLSFTSSLLFLYNSWKFILFCFLVCSTINY